MPTHFLLRNATPNRIDQMEVTLALASVFNSYGTIAYAPEIERTNKGWDALITTPLSRDKTIKALRQSGFHVDTAPFDVENLGMVVK